MSSAVSLPNRTFTGRAKSSIRVVNQYCAHSFTRNWQLPLLNQRKGKNDRRKYSMINLKERMLATRRGSNLHTPDLQSNAHPSEPPRPALRWFYTINFFVPWVWCCFCVGLFRLSVLHILFLFVSVSGISDNSFSLCVTVFEVLVILVSFSSFNLIYEYILVIGVFLSFNLRLVMFIVSLISSFMCWW